MTRELIERLEQAQRDAALVRVARVFVGMPFVDGIVRGLGERIVLVQPFASFEPQGLVVMRVDELVDVERDEATRHFEHILREEGALEEPPAVADLDLADLPNLMAALVARGETLLVGCEDVDDPEEDDAWVGRIETLQEDFAILQEIGGDGHWQADSVEVGYDEISRIEFGSRFLRLMGKYAG